MKLILTVSDQMRYHYTIAVLHKGISFSFITSLFVSSSFVTRILKVHSIQMSQHDVHVEVLEEAVEKASQLNDKHIIHLHGQLTEGIKQKERERIAFFI